MFHVFVIKPQKISGSGQDVKQYMIAIKLFECCGKIWGILITQNELLARTDVLSTIRCGIEVKALKAPLDTLKTQKTKGKINDSTTYYLCHSRVALSLRLSNNVQGLNMLDYLT